MRRGAACVMLHERIRAWGLGSRAPNSGRPVPSLRGMLVHFCAGVWQRGEKALVIGSLQGAHKCSW